MPFVQAFIHVDTGTDHSVVSWSMKQILAPIPYPRRMQHTIAQTSAFQ